MKTLALTIIFTLISVSFADAAQTRTVNVRVNKQQTISGTKLTIKFLALIEDSRCPTNVNCIQAGNAKIKIKISKNGRNSKIVELNTNTDSPEIVHGHKLRLTNLTPAPATNIRINPSAYTATVVLSKV